jgi:hypothetical protein
MARSEREESKFDVLEELLDNDRLSIERELSFRRKATTWPSKHQRISFHLVLQAIIGEKLPTNLLYYLLRNGSSHEVSSNFKLARRRKQACQKDI